MVYAKRWQIGDSLSLVRSRMRDEQQQEEYTILDGASCVTRRFACLSLSTC